MFPQSALTCNILPPLFLYRAAASKAFLFLRLSSKKSSTSGGEREARDREGRRRSGSGEREREVRRRWRERIGSSRDEAGRSKVRGIWAAWWAGPDYFLLLLLSFPFSFSFFFIIYHSKLLF